MISSYRLTNIEHLFVSDETSIRLAIQHLSEGGMQIIILTTASRRFSGILTDSDVRKAILKGIDLDHPVSRIMNSNPLVVPPELCDQSVNEIMHLNHFFHIPVISPNKDIVGLYIAEHLYSPKQRDEAFVIMAGGRGTRLMPLTADTPKPMLHAQGKPILEHVILKAKHNGFSNIVISVGYLATDIINYFGNGEKLDVSIEYISEDRPLGTAGALFNLPASYRKNPIVVTNADLLTSVSYSQMLSHVVQSRASGLIGVKLHETRIPFGVIESSGGFLSSIQEKPVLQHHINAGVYVLNSEILDLVDPDSYLDMPTLFNKALDHGMKINIFPVHEDWIDIGRHEDYQRVA